MQDSSNFKIPPPALAVALTAALLLSAIAIFGQAGPASIQFTDVTKSAGITFTHYTGAFGKKYLPETLGSGVAFIDYDGDGWQDLFFTNGKDWPGQRRRTSTQQLFRNNRRIFDSLKGRVERYANDAEVASGVHAAATPGHSIGHMSFMLSSGGRSLFLQSDVTNHPALFVAHPGWHAMFDQIPDLAEKTRRRVYDMLLTDRVPVLGFHHPAPSVSSVEKTATGYRLIPLDHI